MKYLIMLLIVIGLAVADFCTGFIKAYCTDSVQSSKMRKGGLNKLCEIIVMCAVCGLDIGLGWLGKYYGYAVLSDVAGVVTASAVFVYIAVMEFVSILENYGEINPEAAWIKGVVRKLKNVSSQEKDHK